MAYLTIDDQHRIDSVIEDIGLKTGFSYPEHSLLELAEKVGVKVYENDLAHIEPNLSGIILYDDPTTKTGPKIFIDRGMSKQRKQFTLAHELGHHFLHEGTKLRLDKLDYSKSDKDTKDESEANYFAASLLVPKKLLLKKLEEGYSKDKLAQYFDVSLPVIDNRIRWINNN